MVRSELIRRKVDTVDELWYVTILARVSRMSLAILSSVVGMNNDTCLTKVAWCVFRKRLIEVDVLAKVVIFRSVAVVYRNGAIRKFSSWQVWPMVRRVLWPLPNR